MTTYNKSGQLVLTAFIDSIPIIVILPFSTEKDNYTVNNSFKEFINLSLYAFPVNVFHNTIN